MNPSPSPLPDTDVELLMLARSGQRDAYGQLVARHQTLVASLAYSICGDFRRSQDIAQEAFVSAWQQLGTLQDATKFKSWLCGITRNLSLNFIRQQSRQIDRPALSLDNPVESVDETPGPRDQAVTHEEAAIVWQALEKLPEIYREPLILFYREHHSIERVAAALDLSEDTVKQRLSRGRAMLRDQVESVIERSLGFTTPGVLFTTTVVSALPMVTAQIALATMAGAATKGGAAKASVSLAWLSLGLVPVLNIAVSWFAGHRLVQLARNPGEHAFLKRWVWATGIVSTIAVIGMLALHQWELARVANLQAQIQQQIIQHQPLQLRSAHDTRISALLPLVWLGLCAMAEGVVILWGGRRYLEFYRTWRPSEKIRRRRFIFHFYPSQALAYRSKLTAFGLPLVDIRFGHSPEEPLIRGTARGWIAIGDIAHGVVFALGGFATGGIALGGIAVGVVALGGVSGGLLAMGIVAIGGVANAFLLAVGYEAFGVVLGIGYEAATGMVAVARHIAADAAIFAMAEHVRDSTTREWSETGMLPWIFKVTLYPRMFLGQFAGVVIVMITCTALARRSRAHAAGECLPDRVRLLPSFLGALLVLALLGLGSNIAGGLNSRRLITAKEALIAHARETVLHAANDEARVQARHELGKTLFQTGRPDAALIEFLWCLDEGSARAPDFYWTRLTALLPDIGKLSDGYPPAKAALIKRRDRVQSVFQAGQATESSVDEIVALNRSLHESGRSLALYDQLPKTDKLRPVLRRYLGAQFLSARRYEEAVSVEPLKSILKTWDRKQKSENQNVLSTLPLDFRNRFHDENVHWLADRLEVLAGVGQLDHARELLTMALSYDGNESARAAYHAGLLRAGHAELLAPATPAAEPIVRSPGR